MTRRNWLVQVHFYDNTNCVYVTLVVYCSGPCPPGYTCHWSEVVHCPEVPKVGTDCTMIRQGGQDVVNWILQTAISDHKYRYLDLWDIEDCHLVRIGEYHLPKSTNMVV